MADDNIRIGVGHLGLAGRMNWGAGTKFLPNRAAASGKAEAIMIESLGDGSYTEIGHRSVHPSQHDIPFFDTREEAIEYATQRWQCN